MPGTLFEAQMCLDCRFVGIITIRSLKIQHPPALCPFSPYFGLPEHCADMATELQAISQLLQATLNPQTNKEGEFILNPCFRHTRLFECGP